METLYAALPSIAQDLACSWAGYRRSRLRFSPHFHRTLAAWEQTIAAPLPELHRIQWRRLSHLVQHAREHVPFYRSLPPPSTARDPLEAIGLTLGAIPPLAKSTYRERSSEFLATNLAKRSLVRGKTSGTTGSALPLWWTREALAEEFAAFWRGRRSFGASLDDPNLTFNGQTIVPIRRTRPPFWRTNYWNRQTLFSQYHCSEETLPAYVDHVHRAPAAFAQGYPSFLFLIARALIDAGRPLPSGRLKACFTSSESLLAFQRGTIEAGFAAPVHDRYGVSEFCVSMTQCHAQHMHVDMEYCIVEVETEEETDDWVRGPLLVTGLANEATPLLRYRIGDVGTRSKRPCECGRAGDVFLEIDGRIEDYVRTPDGRLVGRMDHVFKDQLQVAEAQILQDSEERIEVLVVPRKDYDEASERALRKEFRSRLGDELRIDIRYVSSIPREPNGKFRAVKSSVGRLEA